ncbi:phosphatase PAP2 family protein [Mycobacterium sp. NPDC050853]|uniref:phosphatase PAP2 family protein n=1 Tax=Mycobacteriaceae TaxID=1762 RepID=UPI0015DE8801|nr:phosphatase PAP2 family protein [Mycobacteroides sp. LB1]
MLSERQRPAIAGAVLAALFVVLGFVAHAGTVVDHSVLEFMLGRRRDWLTPIAVFITDVVGPNGMWPLGISIGAVLWWRWRKPLPALVIFGTLIATRIAIPLTKHLVGTERPPHAVRLVVEESPSYPSGHSLTTLSVLGVLAVIHGYGRGRTTRIWLWVAAVVGTGAVALTRLYLGVHWLTDVTGGVLLGGVIVIVAGWVYGRYAAPYLSTA